MKILMNEKQALNGFASVAQETRLRIVRLLVTAGADGMAAGAITEAIGASAPHPASRSTSITSKRPA